MKKMYIMAGFLLFAGGATFAQSSTSAGVTPAYKSIKSTVMPTKVKGAAVVAKKSVKNTDSKKNVQLNMQSTEPKATKKRTVKTK